MKKLIGLLPLFVFLLAFNVPIMAQDYESEPEMMEQEPTIDSMDSMVNPMEGEMKKPNMKMNEEEYDEEESGQAPMIEPQAEEVYDSSEDYESY